MKVCGVKGMVIILAVICLAALGMSCGSSSTTASDDSGGDSGGGDDDSGGGGTDTGGATITTNDQVMANIPDADPTTIDYSIAAAAASEVARAFSSSAKEEGDYGDGGGEIVIRVQQTPGDGFGTFTINQCQSGEQMGYAEVSYANDTYNLTVYYRPSSGETYDIIAQMANAALSSSAFSGSADLRAESSARILWTANGGVNVLRGNYGSGQAQMAASMTAAVGCGRGKAGSAESGNIPFDISANAVTRAKTFTDGSENDQCASIPDYISVENNATLTSVQTWDCQLPAGESWVEVDSAMGLEDAGGAECQAQTDFWQDASYDPTSCLEYNNAALMDCLDDVLTAYAVQSIRMAERMFVCKAKGVFNLIDAGTITGATLADGGSVYVQIASIH